ncbi:MAG: NAD-dependent epimerase/dehydratase family protein [Flavobacteriales bacterium]|nr:NAD-dependent epimerase/dehydratase family protein [Flavobacteriales bacterium]MCZ2443929.1 NAD-dependent epimerase/dehydratase family protein [Flavobacteriales bacterium]
MQKNLPKKKALILGATGLVGKHLLQHLLNDDMYEEARVITRRSLHIQHEKLQEIVIDFEQLENYSTWFEVDDVFCCLGTTMKKAVTKEAFYFVDHDLPVRAARMAQWHAQTFIYISSIGSSVASSFYYLRVKGETERDILKTTLSHICILRPSVLIGKREDKERKIEDMGGFILNSLSWLMWGGLKKYRPIHADKVARAMQQLAHTEQKGKYVYESNHIGDIVQNMQYPQPLTPTI